MVGWLVSFIGLSVGSIVRIAVVVGGVVVVVDVIFVDDDLLLLLLLLPLLRLVVKASGSRAADPGFDSSCAAGIFPDRDIPVTKIGTPVATWRPAL